MHAGLLCLCWFLRFLPTQQLAVDFHSLCFVIIVVLYCFGEEVEFGSLVSSQ